MWYEAQEAAALETAAAVLALSARDQASLRQLSASTPPPALLLPPLRGDVRALALRGGGSGGGGGECNSALPAARSASGKTAPQMAKEHNSMPCPYGFGRIVRRPWELQLRVLGFCDFECMCGALRHARDDVVASAGGWPGLADHCKGRMWK